MFYVPARDYIRPKLVVVFVKKISAVCTRKIARRVCYYIRTPHKVLASHNHCGTFLMLKQSQYQRIGRNFVKSSRILCDWAKS